MPIKSAHPYCRWTALAVFASATSLALPAQAQTDDAVPFYAGGSLGVSHVSNLFRQAGTSNSDTVVSTGLLAGLDQKFGRQHFTADGSLQHNRYSSNSGLNNEAYNLRSALNWATVGDLSGTLSASSSRSLADFNIGGGVDPIFKKNIESNNEYVALVRLGLATRYSVEAGWTHHRHDFSAAEYDRFVFHQNTGSLGLYATPGGNLRLGLVARHTRGQYPRYPVGIIFNPDVLAFQIVSAPDDFSRNDVDFTTHWDTGGSSTLDTRLSSSHLKHGLSVLPDFNGTTGAIGWNWQPTTKLQLGLQYSRDTGQDSRVQASDVNRIYNNWRLNGLYALTGKISLNASVGSVRNRSTSATQQANGFENNKAYSLGTRWALSRGISFACQYDYASRDSSIPQYIYNASSYGCTGQAILY